IIAAGVESVGRLGGRLSHEMGSARSPQKDRSCAVARNIMCCIYIFLFVYYACCDEGEWQTGRSRAHRPSDGARHDPEADDRLLRPRAAPTTRRLLRRFADAPEMGVGPTAKPALRRGRPAVSGLQHARAELRRNRRATRAPDGGGAAARRGP